MTCAHLNFQPKPSKNQVKLKALLCKFENLKQFKMWVSNENLHKTKVIDLEKLCEIGIQHFFN